MAGFYQTAPIGGRVNMICEFWPNFVLLANWMMISFGYHYAWSLVLISDSR
jgi:hypothetical protein